MQLTGVALHAYWRNLAKDSEGNSAEELPEA